MILRTIRESNHLPPEFGASPGSALLDTAVLLSTGLALLTAGAGITARHVPTVAVSLCAALMVAVRGGGTAWITRARHTSTNREAEGRDGGPGQRG